MVTRASFACLALCILPTVVSAQYQPAYGQPGTELPTPGVDLSGAQAFNPHSQPAPQFAPAYAPQYAPQYTQQYSSQQYAPQYNPRSQNGPQLGSQYRALPQPQYGNPAPVGYGYSPAQDQVANQYRGMPSPRFEPTQDPYAYGTSAGNQSMPTPQWSPSYNADPRVADPRVARYNPPMPQSPMGNSPMPMQAQPGQGQPMQTQLAPPAQQPMPAPEHVPTPASTEEYFSPKSDYTYGPTHAGSVWGSADASCDAYGNNCGVWSETSPSDVIYDCGPTCTPQPAGHWYGGISALIMTRNLPNRLWVSYETGNNPNQLMHSQDPTMDWRAGNEIYLGKTFGCDSWGLEAKYFYLDPFEASASITHPSTVSTPLILAQMEFALGDLVQGYFDNAAEHTISRKTEIHNMELNARFGDLGQMCGCGWQLQGLAGVRYFRFREDLQFRSLAGGGSYATPTDWAVLQDEITNNMIGLQLGVSASWQTKHKLRFYMDPTFGVYYNRIENHYNIFRGDGATAYPQAGSGVTGTYPVDASADVVSFLTQVDLGMDWQLSKHAHAYIAYRVISAAGVGLADEQIPIYGLDIPEIRDIDNNGDLLLHGALIGVEFTH